MAVFSGLQQCGALWCAGLGKGCAESVVVFYVGAAIKRGGWILLCGRDKGSTNCRCSEMGDKQYQGLKVVEPWRKVRIRRREIDLKLTIAQEQKGTGG